MHETFCLGGKSFLVKRILHYMLTHLANPLLAKLLKLKAVSLYARSKRAGISLGVIRLDYHYPPAPGDVAHPGRQNERLADAYWCIASCIESR